MTMWKKLIWIFFLYKKIIKRDSPIWNNNYLELAKWVHGVGWKVYGIFYRFQIFKNGVFLPFASLQAIYSLPAHVHVYYLQLWHVVRAQDWRVSPTNRFNPIQMAERSTGFISQCYSMLLAEFHNKGHPCKETSRWEWNLGLLSGEQWEEVCIRL